MSWSAIEEFEVLQEFTPQEQATLKNIQGNPAEEVLPAILTRTVRAARGSILAGGNQLGAADTIPDQLRNDVITIARWRLLISFPQMRVLQTAERKAAYDDAMKRLDGIAEGKPKVEVPDDPITTTTSATLPSIDPRCRDFEKGDEDGI